MERVIFKTFQQDIAAAGNPVQLEENPVDLGTTIEIRAKAGNGGNMTLGYTSATALNTNSDHYALDAGESVKLENTDNSNRIWVDTDNNGDGIEVIIS